MHEIACFIELSELSKAETKALWGEAESKWDRSLGRKPEAKITAGQQQFSRYSKLMGSLFNIQTME